MTATRARAVLGLLCLAGPSAAQTPGLEAEAGEFREAFGRELLGAAASDKLLEVEGKLLPLYQALPKNPNGRLGHAAASYALGKYFSRKYGWTVKGLKPEGSAWSGPPEEISRLTQGRVPALFQDIAEDHLKQRGLDLEALSVLATLLEKALLEEDQGGLKHAYRLVDSPVRGRATEEQVKDAIEMYMLMYITGSDSARYSPASAKKFRALAQVPTQPFAPLWNETRTWLRDVEQGAAYSLRASENPFVKGAMTFHDAELWMKELHRQYAQYQQRECVEMREILLSLEDTRGTGRLSLARFQNSSKAGDKWKFTESAAELQESGCLDVSDPERPRVIVANYVLSTTNCLAGSGLHSVCCVDECEALMGEVERAVAAPAGASEDIVRTVGQLGSATVDAPRNLSRALVGRLETVAARHGGQVPLHGRLFAQWMHHAFPNECAHPLPSAWADARAKPKGLRSTREVMQEEASGAGAAGELLPWSAEEELIEGDYGLGGGGGGLWRLVMLAAFLCVAVVSARSGLSEFLGFEQGRKFWTKQEELPGFRKQR